MSPGTTYISLVDASRVWLTTNDAISFKTSTQALIAMDDAPTMDSSSGTPSTGVSIFQTESMALLATRYLNWQPAAGQSHAATLTNVEW